MVEYGCRLFEKNISMFQGPENSLLHNVNFLLRFVSGGG